MNDPKMMNQNFGIWPPPEDYQKGFSKPSRPVFAAGAANSGRGKWKGKKSAEKRRNEKSALSIGDGSGRVGSSGYKPPTLHELQFQNRMKARRFYPKKKFNRFAPYAPRNTTSFIIRSKKSGGITSLVSPCPVTPAILPTPIFSPSREALVDTAKEEWGVDGYGTMKGLIRLRSPGHENRDEEEEDEGSSESDVEEHVEVERRLDHDLSRFEMVYPNFGDGHAILLENRVDDQESHIAQLEEENLTLKERLFLMESEMANLRRRLRCLEAEKGRREENMELGSDNEGGGDAVFYEKSFGNDENGVDIEDKSIGNEQNGVGEEEVWIGNDEKSVGVEEKGIGNDEKGGGVEEKGIGNDERVVGEEEMWVGNDEKSLGVQETNIENDVNSVGLEAMRIGIDERSSGAEEKNIGND